MRKGRKSCFKYIWLLLALVLALAGCRRGGASAAGGTSAGAASAAEAAASDTADAGKSDVDGSADSADTSEDAGNGASVGTSDADSVVDAAIAEDGAYTSKDEVALYLHTYGKLPPNFISKSEARALGWNAEQGNLRDVAPGMSIGGDVFGNREGLLPDAAGRTYYECDINYAGGRRGAERIVYSSDGLIFYTGDHYASYEQLYP